MRAYKIEHTWEIDDDTMTMTRFAGTYADAKATRREIGAAAGLDPNQSSSAIEIGEVEISTVKADLLAFINSLIA